MSLSVLLWPGRCLETSLCAQPCRQHSARQVYQRFLDQHIPVHGADLCDMSGAVGRTLDQYTVFNVIQSRLYFPEWQGNLFEQRCQASASSATFRLQRWVCQGQPAE